MLFESTKLIIFVTSFNTEAELKKLAFINPPKSLGVGTRIVEDPRIVVKYE